MRLLNKYQKVIDKLLRPGTRRRSCYELGLNGIRIILNEGWNRFFCKDNLWIRNQKEKSKKGYNSLTVFNVHKKDGSTELLKLKYLSSNKINKSETKKIKRSLLIAVAVVKNESDIISTWLAHVSSLFDMICIVDHNSTDGTREYVLKQSRKYENIHLFSFAHPGHFQMEITNKLSEFIIKKHPDSWIFPLDADEFLVKETKEQLITDLNYIDKNKVLEMTWRNVLPIKLTPDKQFCFNTSCLIQPGLGLYKKVAIHSSNFAVNGLRFVQGNHNIQKISWNNKNKIISTNFGELLHIPIRSVDQLIYKCIRGYLGYAALPVERNHEGMGFHQKMMIQRISEIRNLNLDIFRDFVVNYGHPELCTKNGISVESMIKAGWSNSTIKVSHIDNYSIASRNKMYLELAKELLINFPNNDLKDTINIVESYNKNMLDKNNVLNI